MRAFMLGLITLAAISVNCPGQNGDADSDQAITAADLVLVANHLAGNISHLPWNTNGLSLHLPFNGNANDVGPGGYHGTVNGPVLAADRFGRADSAYVFDGVDDYISTSYPGVLGQAARTVSLWAKTTSTSFLSLLTWGSYEGGGGKTFRCILNYNQGGVCVTINDDMILYDAVVADDLWHHYVWVVPEIVNPHLSDVLVYQDGKLLTEIAEVLGPDVYVIDTVNDTPVRLGIPFNPVNTYFPGALDDIRIYSRALTEYEILGLYHELSH